jgi:hypothetical protein
MPPTRDLLSINNSMVPNGGATVARTSVCLHVGGMANKRRTSSYHKLVGNVRTCTVSFTGPSGTRHTVNVTAESLYEAVLVGVRAISEHWGEGPTATARIAVEVRSPSVTHEVCLKQIRQWAEGTATSPKERLLKDSLKSLLIQL